MLLLFSFDFVEYRLIVGCRSGQRGSDFQQFQCYVGSLVARASSAARFVIYAAVASVWDWSCILCLWCWSHRCCWRLLRHYWLGQFTINFQLPMNGLGAVDGGRHCCLRAGGTRSNSLRRLSLADRWATFQYSGIFCGLLFLLAPIITMPVDFVYRPLFERFRCF